MCSILVRDVVAILVACRMTTVNSLASDTKCSILAMQTTKVISWRGLRTFFLDTHTYSLTHALTPTHSHTHTHAEPYGRIET